MESLDLHQWQVQFKRWLQDEILTELQVQELATFISGDGPAELGSGRSSRRRIEAYRYAYRARLIESLIDDFPRLVSKLGEEKFRALALSYLEKEPSPFTSVGDFSFPFPEFVRRNSNEIQNADECAALADFELDLLRVERSSVDQRWLKDAQKTDFETRPFEVNSTLLIREYAFRVEESQSPLSQLPVTLALYATDSVEWLVLDSDSVSILNELKNELHTLGLEALVERWTERAVNPEKLQEWITDWVRYGILIAR